MAQMEEALQEFSEHAPSAAARRAFKQAEQQLHRNLLRARNALGRMDSVREGRGRLDREVSSGGPRSGAPGSAGAGPLQQAHRPGGERRVLDLSPQAARFVKGKGPGCLQDLRISSTVQLAVYPRTGEVRVVRILPE